MFNIIGLALIIASVYFLGQNISFTTHYYYSWWQKIPATASVLALLGGIASLTFWRQTMGNLGWMGTNSRRDSLPCKGYSFRLTE
jgi:hypothetical protein